MSAPPTEPGGLLVVAGEASADLHASHVLTQLRLLKPALRVGGIGGQGCRDAGMDILVDNRNLSVMGFTEVLGALGRVRRAFKTVLRWVDSHHVKAALLIDFADFNLRLARALKKRGVKVIYFISPKVWAWRQGRVKQLRERVDHMLVIFPFEVAFFARHGITAEYVGNPTLDELATPPRRAPSRETLHVPEGQRVVALLPGSRNAEIRRHMQPMLAAATLLHQQQPGTRFLLPRASTISAQSIQPQVDAARAHGLTVEVVDGHAPEVLAAADAAIVASGTATLETALIGTPMVVIYRLSALTFFFASLFIKMKHFSLVNILTGREVVRELLQHHCTPQGISDEISALLAPARNQAQRAELLELRTLLGAPGAPQRVAARIASVLDAG